MTGINNSKQKEHVGDSRRQVEMKIEFWENIGRQASLGLKPSVFGPLSSGIYSANFLEEPVENEEENQV